MCVCATRSKRCWRPAGPDRALAIERFIVDRQSMRRGVDPLLGSRLGPWRLVSVLGRGGMGTVYRAERADGQYRQEVAVKILRSGPRDPYAIERFRTERQVLAHLTHPNIAGLLDGGFAPDGTPYLVMELVDGVPITRMVRRRASSARRLGCVCFAWCATPCSTRIAPSSFTATSSRRISSCRDPGM